MKTENDRAEHFRVIARVVILTLDQRVALVTSRDGKALVLPGGAVDEGETLPQAAAREAFEECGVLVAVGRAIWLREFVERGRERVNLEVYFLGRPADAIGLPERWRQPDPAHRDLTREAGLYSRQDIESLTVPVYPAELREALWVGLADGFGNAYLGRVEG